jgi:hypothetical protein
MKANTGIHQLRNVKSPRRHTGRVFEGDLSARSSKRAAARVRDTVEEETIQLLRAEHPTLRIRNISAETSPLDLVELFSERRFHPADVRIDLLCAQELVCTEALVSLPKDEADEAFEWLSGRHWRGQRLNVVMQPDEGFDH